MNNEFLLKKYKTIIHYIGVVLVLTSAILLIPLVMVPFYKDDISQIPYFLIPSAATFMAGMILRKFKISEIELQYQDAGIVIVVSWILVILITGTPFILGGYLNFSQSVFEATSAWTTTGLSMVNVEKMSNTFLFWRSVMQFFGGAGIAVVMLAAVIGPKGAGLYSAEGRTDKLLPNIINSAKIIMGIYTSFVLIGVLLYCLAGMPLFDSINHSIAALSTGGFSTKVDSIGAYHSILIEFITIILMILGTINFAVHYILIKGNIKRVLKIGELRLMFLLIFLGVPITAFFGLYRLYGSLGQSFRISLFELVSALSTTGFSTVSYVKWPGIAVFIMIIFMIIGGGAGSTAGGLKQFRIYIMLKSVYWSVKRSFQPKNTVHEDYIVTPEGEYYIKDKEILSVYVFTMLYMIIYVIGVGILTINGYSLRDSMFEFASSLSTVGLSIGITSPDANLAVIWTEIAGMFLGRLEIYVVIFAVIKIFRDKKLSLKNK